MYNSIFFSFFINETFKYTNIINSYIEFFKMTKYFQEYPSRLT